MRSVWSMFRVERCLLLRIEIIDSVLKILDYSNSLIFNLNASINGDKRNMEIPEKQVIASLMLLTGLTFLIVGWYTGQLGFIADFVKNVFQPAVAGMP